MKTLTPQPPSLTAAQISEDWIGKVAAIARRDGHALRAGDGNTIEAQTINEPQIWQRVMLEHSSFTFTTAGERDQVLERIQRRAAT